MMQAGVVADSLKKAARFSLYCFDFDCNSSHPQHLIEGATVRGFTILPAGKVDCVPRISHAKAVRLG